MTTLTDRDVVRARTASLLLAGPTGARPAEVAAWFGAMQAQDYESGLWSFGVRTGQTRKQVEAAVQSGEVLRTWPMRGTLHFVAAADARWLLATTGTRHLEARVLGKRWDYLGLDRATATRALQVLERELTGRQLTRAETLAALNQAGIDTAGQRGYHLLWFSAQSGLTCVGPNEGKEQTFALLDEWAPEQNEVAAEAALGELALRYFRSHGPTTRQDFAGWAGITAAEAKAGISDAGAALTTALHEGRELLMAVDLLDRVADVIGGADRQRIRMLPGFDEFLLGYKDRTLAVPAAFADRIVPGNNGVFQPTITRDGRVLGIWRRSVKARSVRLTAHPFTAPSAAVGRGIALAAADYARFVGLQADVTIEAP